jgi:hypothetical protein
VAEPKIEIVKAPPASAPPESGLGLGVKVGVGGLLLMFVLGFIARPRTKSAPVVGVRRYSAVVDDSGRVPFANAIKSLYGGNVGGFDNWVNKVLARGVQDAYTHAAIQLKAAMASAVITHYQCWRRVFDGQALPQNARAAFEESLQRLEEALSYDCLAKIERLALDSTFTLRESPINKITDDLDWLTNGSSIGARQNTIAKKRTLVEHTLTRGRDDVVAHFSLLFIFAFPEWFGDPNFVSIHFAGLATALRTLSARERNENARLAARCRKLALLCAARVDPNDVEYADLENKFRDRGEALPDHDPRPPAQDTWRITPAGELVKLGADKGSADHGTTDSSPPVSEDQAPEENEIDERRLMKGVEKSLHGLVGLDSFKQQFAHDIVEFLASRQSRGRVFWGSSGVGKTEVAQRLAGLREGFPQLPSGSGEFRYVSGVDGRLEVKELVDGLPPFSVLFIDEADKSLDPREGMVTAAEATQLRHAIVTHFQRKPLLWVFLGVFAQMRSGGALTDDALRVTFGDELAHRLDYADWGFPDWTLSNLLKAVKGGTSGRDVDYENDAVQELAQYCITSGGGVRAFDNLEIAIARHLRATKQPPGTKVSLAVAREILAKRGVRSAG